MSSLWHTPQSQLVQTLLDNFKTENAYLLPAILKIGERSGDEILIMLCNSNLNLRSIHSAQMK